tara:strand:+ start:81 stop:767 length:687 start_codon:yes stop_codon:yes gene_type:complete
MEKFGVIVQARSGSKRFPNKIFHKIGKYSILDHVIRRIKKTKFKKKIIIASSIKTKRKKIISIAKKNKCMYFFGSEKDVLKRFYNTAKKFDLKFIMRISGDSPFIDPNIIQKAYLIFKKKKFDVVTNILYPTFPKGMSVEIFNISTLKRLNRTVKNLKEREHVTSFIYKNLKLFKINNFKSKTNLRNLSFTVDTLTDLKKMKFIYSKLIRKKIEKNFLLKNLVKIVNI